MVEAQCLCRSAWRKSDKSNKKRRVSTESETQTPHLYHCFLSFLGDFDFIFQAFLCICWTVESNKKGWTNHGIFQRGRLGKVIFMFFQLGPTPKTTPSGPVKPWKPRKIMHCTGGLEHQSLGRFMCEKPRNSRCTKKIHFALLHQFVKNSPTWNIWSEYWNLNVNSQAIIGERQDTKIRNPEPMLKDCTPPAALTLEKWHFGTSHLELTSCRSVGGWKTVNKSKLTSH